MVVTSKNIVIIGSGNVASHIANTLKHNAKIIQVYSKHLMHAESLANSISQDCKSTDNINNLFKADIYIIAIKDDQINLFLNDVPQSLRNAYWVHTSGSVSRNVFDNFNDKNGVIYPLQTFSKNVEINVREISFFVEGNTPEVEDELLEFTKLISNSVFRANSNLRKQLHVSAVFANNFTNYMYTIADDILKRNGLPFSVLTPLIKETVRKATSIPPYEAQTGPAVRGDLNVINSHLDLLKDDESILYKVLSESILKRYKR